MIFDFYPQKARGGGNKHAALKYSSVFRLIPLVVVESRGDGGDEYTEWLLSNRDYAAREW